MIASPMQLPPEIFKAYDIRGVVGKTLTPAIVRAVGQALGSLARERGRDTLVDRPRRAALGARAVRRRSPTASAPTGANVVDVGMVTTPMTYFAAQHLGTQCSVMVTGSHNPPDYNGLKMVIAGDTLSGDDIQALARAHRGGRASRSGAGTYRAHDIAPAYLDRIVGDVHARAADAHRRRLRQRRRRRLRADAVSAARLRRSAELYLRGRRHISRTIIPIRRSPKNLRT